MEKKIVIIGDDSLERDTLTQVLIALGHIVKTINDVENIYLTLHLFNPTVIVMDIDLYRSDGRTVCNEIKSSLLYWHIPVILLTSLSHDEIGIIECEADAILGKPIDTYNLLLAIESFTVT